MISPESYYKDHVRDYDLQQTVVRNRISVISVLRLILFCGFALSVYLLIHVPSWTALLSAAILLAVFIGLVYQSQRLKERRMLLEKLSFVSSNELGILKHTANRLSDGQAFLKNENYLDDLDIFGKGSVYHLLNRTTSSHGATALAALLSQPLMDTVRIGEQQKAIRELSQQTDHRQLIIAHGLITGEGAGNLYSLVCWLEIPTRLIRKKWLMTLRWVIIAYNTLSLAIWIWTGNYQPLIPGIVCCLILGKVFARYFIQQYNLLNKKQPTLEQYAMTLDIFNKMDSGGSALLKSLQEKTRNAHREIRGLARILDLFDRQLNPLVGFPLNLLFAYNVQVLIALEKWRMANKKDLFVWIDTVGQIECLNSLSCFAYNNPGFCYPAAMAAATGETEAAGFIRAKAMAHPLLPDDRVANDLSIGEDCRIMLVTGSNMSGKTTFLRTLGVNLLLAQCGAPVCAGEFSFTPMQILSSLRISDSLQESTSYFMAELKKLQEIIHRLKEGPAALVLVDEILRGTNSEDKTYGSQQFLLKLLQYRCVSLFATHDLSLGSLEGERPGLVCNYCFESIIKEDALLFDYRLQKGIARNRNASFLMKKMEII